MDRVIELVDDMPLNMLASYIVEITETRRCQSYNHCTNETQQMIIRNNKFNSTIVYAESLAGYNWLPVEQQIANAEYIYNYLLAEGWTVEAISGMLGNIMVESYLNPASSQSAIENPKGGNGYGIFHWDPPQDKILRWIGKEDKTELNDITNNSPRILMDLQLEYFIISSTRPIEPKDGGETMYLEFYEDDKGNGVNYYDYITMEKSPEEMADLFRESYERNGDHSRDGYRREWAEDWYKYFKNNDNTGIINHYREDGFQL